MPGLHQICGAEICVDLWVVGICLACMIEVFNRFTGIFLQEKKLAECMIRIRVRTIFESVGQESLCIAALECVDLLWFSAASGDKWRVIET